jgi:APA family basic amino acid/polyamine antiporter
MLPLTALSQLVSIGSYLAFTLVCVGVVILRRTRPDLHRPFRVPGVPWVPILGALVCISQMASLPWSTWERLIVWLVAGLAIYFLYSRRRAREKRAELAAATMG